MLLFGCILYCVFTILLTQFLQDFLVFRLSLLVDKYYLFWQNKNMNKILLLNGPNINMLGQREQALYGSLNLNQLETALIAQAKLLGYELNCFQSNSESALINKIHTCSAEHISFILFNPAAFTHTSIALRDALLSVQLPFIEIHISNTYARESFRHKSLLSDIAHGVVLGFGTYGYDIALLAADKYLKTCN